MLKPDFEEPKERSPKSICSSLLAINQILLNSIGNVVSLSIRCKTCPQSKTTTPDQRYLTHKSKEDPILGTIVENGELLQILLHVLCTFSSTSYNYMFSLLSFIMGVVC